jgi:hypothetical protein
MAAGATGEDPEALLVAFADESGYRTPKVDVRGVVLDADRLLLVREAGLDVRAVRPLGVFDRDFRGRLRWPAHVYKLYLLCELLGGEPVADGLETDAAEFFALETLPTLSLKTPGDQLERALAVALDPSKPAALD